MCLLGADCVCFGHILAVLLLSSADQDVAQCCVLGDSELISQKLIKTLNIMTTHCRNSIKANIVLVKDNIASAEEAKKEELVHFTL